MTNRHDELAQKVVQTFKAELPEQVLSEISEGQFDELAAMIREAISEELRFAAELIEQAARRLRKGVERPELGL
jgi:hypothetical protein